MCSTERTRQPRSDLFYNPETKCCTYIPTLPNYLVGRILGDDDSSFASGRKTVEERLRAGLAVTPLGLGMPPTFTFLYAQTAGRAFGLSKSLRCPHYLSEEGGRCGIWKHRASVCATWYCKHVRGAVGAKFWASLNQLLAGVEQSLSHWCVYELEIEIEALRLLFPPRSVFKNDHQLDDRALDGTVDPRMYELLWGKWLGREEEFYREATRLVNGLAWKDVVSIGGTEIKVRERLVRDTYDRLMSEELPPSLRVGRLNVLSMGRETCRVTTYSTIDPLDLPQSLITVLPYFDGRPTLDAMEAIEKHEGIKLDVALVRKLADFEILIPTQ
jgi:Fe-S-cluster containining protein